MRLCSENIDRSGSQVVVFGEGTDEVLGGYDIFKESKICGFWESQPDSKRRARLRFTSRCA
ncbi:MAG: asparagine synthase-related protein [Candidatus Acidiferrales bacterium]